MYSEEHNILIKKAKENMKSGSLLLANKCFSSSIHCFYYSAYQFCTIYLSDMVSQPTELDNQNECSQNANLGSHGYVIKELAGNFNDAEKGRIFEEKILDLKKLRIMADYLCDIATKEEAEKAKNEAVNLIDILEKEFGKYEKL